MIVTARSAPEEETKAISFRPTFRPPTAPQESSMNSWIDLRESTLSFTMSEDHPRPSGEFITLTD